MARWLGYVQLVLIVAAVAVALWFARAPERVQRGVASDLTDEKAKPAVSVIRTAPVTQSLTVKLTGSVRMERRARIASEVVGRVVFVSPKFASGGTIAADETFIRVDPAGFDLEVEAAEQARGSVWVVDGGMLRAFVPRTVGRTGDGRVVEAFDTSEGVVVGALPGARAEAADVLSAVEGAVDAIERFPPPGAERPEGELRRVPLVVSMLGGLALATLFVLFLLPALVMMIDGRRD